MFLMEELSLAVSSDAVVAWSIVGGSRERPRGCR